MCVCVSRERNRRSVRLSLSSFAATRPLVLHRQRARKPTSPGKRESTFKSAERSPRNFQIDIPQSLRGAFRKVPWERRPRRGRVLAPRFTTWTPKHRGEAPHAGGGDVLEPSRSSTDRYLAPLGRMIAIIFSCGSSDRLLSNLANFVG